jgi:hypothetical protein
MLIQQAEEFRGTTVVCKGCVTKYHKDWMGTLNNRDLFTHNFGSWRSEIKVSSGLVSPENAFFG